MQAFLEISVLIIGVAAIILGMIMGYLLGGQSNLKPVDRVLVGAISGFIGGIIINIVLESILLPIDSTLLISILSCLGGVFFGESINWAPPPKRAPKRHVFFDLDEEEEFDREIEEALRGTS